ncbi:hypothetical protein SH1V18_03890 [Vallitalea longa]|uniref:Uncharacterized protein n=1 Tax=Vallitalea longa TaxID=2936439 RepID=A0A9W5Y9L3_9FIRM|nr:hypothetical protein [Vallitalea longa]GKX27909.1 hypothetical protein SH1V18_03890 [Vallitalea longa]
MIIEYFFCCYFNMSADYSEIEDLVNEFKEIEIEEYIIDLEKELTEIVNTKNWNVIIEIAHDSGGRLLSSNKAEMLSIFLLKFIKGDTNINVQDLYEEF